MRKFHWIVKFHIKFSGFIHESRLAEINSRRNSVETDLEKEIIRSHKRDRKELVYHIKNKIGPIVIVAGADEDLDFIGFHSPGRTTLTAAINELAKAKPIVYEITRNHLPDPDIYIKDESLSIIEFGQSKRKKNKKHGR